MEYIKIISIKTLQPNTIANLPFPVANNAVIESALFEVVLNRNSYWESSFWSDSLATKQAFRKKNALPIKTPPTILK